MLGEKHSLVNEFPKLKERIAELVKSDTHFAKDTQEYNELDKEIRKLELAGTPISDQSIHEMKQERAELKDSLYCRLLNSTS